MKLVALVAVVACGRHEPKPIAEPAPAAVARIDAGVAVIPASARELVTAVVEDWDATRATLRRYRRDGAAWQAVGDAWPGVIGASGAGWGVGLHGSGAPAGRGGPVKREGDTRSPAGVFALRGAYGYAGAAPSGTRLPYTRVDAAWQCVDDPDSRHYARIFDRRAVATDWKTAEDMRRSDDLYTWVVDIAHNPDRTRGAGSCIFLHVWGGIDSATIGCTAMAEDRLAELIATLDPGTVFVLLPKSEYAALAPVWALP